PRKNPPRSGLGRGTQATPPKTGGSPSPETLGARRGRVARLRRAEIVAACGGLVISGGRMPTRGGLGLGRGEAPPCRGRQGLGRRGGQGGGGNLRASVAIPIE